MNFLIGTLLDLDPIAFLLQLVFGMFWCYGVFKIFDDILMKQNAWMQLKIGVKWCKPLFLCPPCMGSVHGLAIAATFYPGHLFIIIFYCVCLCGLNYLMQQFLPEYD